MPINSIVVETWPQVTIHADNLHAEDEVIPRYLFRGHEDAGWTLKPSLHRAVSNDLDIALPPAADLLTTETILFEQFRKFAPNHLPAATFGSTHAEFDWWTLMRHYGVPTRLLDWTTSFYVALYFATCGQAQRDGAIYVVHPHTLQTAMAAAHGNAATVGGQALNAQLLRVDAPPIVSFHGRRTALLDRMIVQQGVFMCCHNVAGDIEAQLTAEIPKVANPATVSLQKLIVPAAMKHICMKKLRAMNVTGSSLFPGLDGIGRHLDEYARNRHA